MAATGKDNEATVNMAKVREIGYNGEKFTVEDSGDCELKVTDSHGEMWLVQGDGRPTDPFHAKGFGNFFSTVGEAINFACERIIIERREKLRKRFTPEEACEAMHKYVEDA